MRYVVHVAPDDIRRMALVLGDTLHIWVGDQVDDVARERYIQDKLLQHGIKRRRGLVALIPAAGGHAAGHSKTTSAAMVAGTGVVAVSVAAAVIVPAVLDGHRTPAHRRPAVAAPAPAPARPGSPRSVSRPPTSPPSRPPGTAGPPSSAAPPVPSAQGPVNLPVPGVTVPVGAPAGVPVVSRPKLPKLPVPPAPKPPPVTTRLPSPLLAVSLPPAVGVKVRVNPTLSVRAHLGSLHLGLGSGQPVTGASGGAGAAGLRGYAAADASAAPRTRSRQARYRLHSSADAPSSTS